MMHGSRIEQTQRLPKKLMTIKNTAQVTLARGVSGPEREARYFPREERPIPRRAPRILRHVSSSCCARLSCTEKTSSFKASTRKANCPPRWENGRITMMMEQSRVERSLARGRRANHCLATDKTALRLRLHVSAFPEPRSVMGQYLKLRLSALEEGASGAGGAQTQSAVGAADGPMRLRALPQCGSNFELRTTCRRSFAAGHHTMHVAERNLGYTPRTLVRRCASITLPIDLD